MRTSVLQRVLAIGFILTVLSASIAQKQSSNSTTASQATGEYASARAKGETSKAAMESAIKNGSFQFVNGEYKLEHPINAESSPTEGDNVIIDYQIGKIDGKPASVSFVVNKKRAPKDLKGADEMFGFVPVKPVRISGSQKESPVQRCPNGRKCVQTDANGNCIKWICL